MRARLYSNAGRGRGFVNPSASISSPGTQNSLIDPFLTSSTIWWKLVSMCLIFDVFETPFESCKVALLSTNKSGTANSSGVPSILDTRLWDQIACRKAILNAMYLASVVDPATDLYFVLLKHTTSPIMVNTNPRIDFRSVGSDAWSASENTCISSFFDVPAWPIMLWSTMK